MNPYITYAIYAVLSAAVLVGLYMQSRVKSAVAGNLLCVGAMLAAIVVTFITNSANIWFVLVAVAVGTVVGLVWAKKVKMIEMPQMVGMLNGIGGLASAMVGAIELMRVESSAFANVTAALALVIGGVTFAGSLIAALKLARKIDTRPKRIPGYSVISIALIILMIGSCVLAGIGGFNLIACIVGAVSSLAFGWVFAMRVGGADMPVAISLLNSLSGVAGAIAGMAISNILLVSIGGIVGSSGLLLTNIMCRAMNRKLSDVLLGSTAKPQEKTPEAPVAEAAPVEEAQEEEEVEEDNFKLTDAKDVIIVPGYGMALSQAQHKVRELTERLEKNGARVRFAIHPVAGRMPGHMNVLLCEADIDYDYLYELDAINDDFANTDAVIVVGASDVMNPAAREAEGTPIYGMPILNVDQAKHIIVCNFDLKPGYAGVENPIYTRKHGIRLLLGDAKDSLDILVREF